MEDGPRKVPSSCPHCGHVQHESAYLISTYCRGCGKHYRVSEGRDSGRAAAKKAGTQRTIHCHRCGQDHEVSKHARSTMCPGCNSAIELGDLSFSSNVSRPVDTRGKLTVTASGYLNTSLAICGEAVIQGRISGKLLCENTLRIVSSEKMSCHIRAGTVIVEKGSSADMPFPIKTNDLTVNGRARGNFECTGTVLIRKGGALEGRLSAKTVIVEQGGSLVTDSTIIRSDLKHAPAPLDQAGPLPTL